MSLINDIDHLPNSLTYLKLMAANSPPLDHLPLSLDFISFSFLNLLFPPDHLPPNLTKLHLEVTNFFTFPLDHLPSSLVSLDLAINEALFPITQFNHLPSSLLHLETEHNWEGLPPNLTHLYLPSVDTSLYSIPHNLTSLAIGDAFNALLPPLPSSLTTLILGASFDQPLENFAQLVSLSTLRFISNLEATLFNHPIDELPLSIRVLELGDGFDLSVSSLHNKQSLVYLYLGTNFNQPVDNLPPSLQYLSLGDNFNHPLDNLPTSIKQYESFLILIYEYFC